MFLDTYSLTCGPENGAAFPECMQLPPNACSFPRMNFLMTQTKTRSSRGVKGTSRRPWPNALSPLSTSMTVEIE